MGLHDDFNIEWGKRVQKVDENNSTNFFMILINFSWSKTPAKERAKIMMKVADIVESRLHEFAKAESKDQGKPHWLAELIDIPRVLLNMRSFAVAIQNQVNR